MSLVGNRCIGILREAKNKWERRVPLAPSQVKQLVEKGIKVLVQPSLRRIFHDSEYVAAGAVVQDDMTPASCILGVKEVPIKELIPDRTYVFFFPHFYMSISKYSNINELSTLRSDDESPLKKKKKKKKKPEWIQRRALRAALRSKFPQL